MATTQQLLTIIDEMYPNAVSSTTKVEYMNMAQDGLSNYFGITVIDETLVTVASQDSYAFPTGITDVSQIECLDVGCQATPADRYNYTRYTASVKDDSPPPYNSYRQLYSVLGVKTLLLYPVPTTAGLPIRIRYHKKLTDLSPTTLTASPEFDSRFHDMLAIYACHMICASGNSPDALQANMFMQKYDDAEGQLWKLKMDDELTSPRKRRDNKQWYTRR